MSKETVEATMEVVTEEVTVEAPKLLTVKDEIAALEAEFARMEKEVLPKLDDARLNVKRFDADLTYANKLVEALHHLHEFMWDLRLKTVKHGDQAPIEASLDLTNIKLEELMKEFKEIGLANLLGDEYKDFDQALANFQGLAKEVISNGNFKPFNEMRQNIRKTVAKIEKAVQDSKEELESLATEINTCREDLFNAKGQGDILRVNAKLVLLKESVLLRIVRILADLFKATSKLFDNYMDRKADKLLEDSPEYSVPFSKKSEVAKEDYKGTYKKLADRLPKEEVPAKPEVKAPKRENVETSPTGSTLGSLESDHLMGFEDALCIGNQFKM